MNATEFLALLCIIMAAPNCLPPLGVRVTEAICGLIAATWLAWQFAQRLT